MSTTREWRCERCTATYRSPDDPWMRRCSGFNIPCQLTEVYVVPVGEAEKVNYTFVKTGTVNTHPRLVIPMPEEKKS